MMPPNVRHIQEPGKGQHWRVRPTEVRGDVSNFLEPFISWPCQSPDLHVLPVQDTWAVRDAVRTNRKELTSTVDPSCGEHKIATIIGRVHCSNSVL